MSLKIAHISIPVDLFLYGVGLHIFIGIDEQCAIQHIVFVIVGVCKKLYEVCFVIHSKDVRLPIQLQRAMAAEAEAAREAKAKVSDVY